ENFPRIVSYDSGSDNYNGYAIRRLHKGDGRFEIHLSTDVRRLDAESSEALGEVIPLNEWQFVAMTYDGSHVRGYQDGELTLETPITGNINYTGTTFLSIGSRQGLSTNAYAGDIDDVRV